METLNYYIENKVLTIELNRPTVHNAINYKMMDELQEVLKHSDDNREIKVILLRGTGNRSFAAGGDLAEFHGIKTEAEAFEMLHKMGKILNHIANSSKLTIAAINGYALGGGAELTTAFDIRVASDTAKIGFIQRNLGLTTGWGGGSRLFSILGLSKAMPLLIRGEILSSQELFELGYLYKIYPSSNFIFDAQQFAIQCTEMGDHVLEAYKEMSANFIDRNRLHQNIENEIRTCARLWVEEEHLTAVERFLSKKTN